MLQKYNQDDENTIIPMLPLELLVIILSYMDKEKLKELCLVNKTWNKLIIESIFNKNALPYLEKELNTNLLNKNSIKRYMMSLKAKSPNELNKIANHTFSLFKQKNSLFHTAGLTIKQTSYVMNKPLQHVDAKVLASLICLILALFFIFCTLGLTKSFGWNGFQAICIRLGGNLTNITQLNELNDHLCASLLQAVLLGFSFIFSLKFSFSFWHRVKPDIIDNLEQEKEKSLDRLLNKSYLESQEDNNESVCFVTIPLTLT